MHRSIAQLKAESNQSEKRRFDEATSGSYETIRRLMAKWKVGIAPSDFIIGDLYDYSDARIRIYAAAERLAEELGDKETEEHFRTRKMVTEYDDIFYEDMIKTPILMPTCIQINRETGDTRIVLEKRLRGTPLWVPEGLD